VAARDIVDQLTGLLAHPVFLSAFSSWLSAQILKSIVALFRNRPRTAKGILLDLFWTTGGMPSSHSAVVAALATSVGFVEGIDSPLFIGALIGFFIAVAFCSL
jgi:acid phosphatase family membrane protein YuiD